ncbi:MAG: tRNA pseudouridine(38-40) synthase TruA [Candidatus Hodarchaeales archaeon]|jgi:tRNA pseudouridine38-40 synthase
MTINSWALKVAYLGKGYHGFQIQPGFQTIEEVLRKALSKTGITGNMTTASRTDAGVNALGTVVVITTESNIRLDAINRCLPGDIAIWGITKVSSSFNPRRDCIMKIYRYYVYSDQLDLESMKKSAVLITGCHDFRNFAKRDSKKPMTRTMRTLDTLEIMRREGYLEITFGARFFLWQMCRRIAQHLIDVGKRVTTTKETALLISNNRLDKGSLRCPSPAPPENLFLHKIIYENIKFDLYPKYLEKLEKDSQERQQLLKNQLKHEIMLQNMISSRIQKIGETKSFKE